MSRQLSADTGLASGQNLAHILPPSWREDIPRWFAEDTPSFDWAGFVVGEQEQEAVLWGKSGVSIIHLRPIAHEDGGVLGLTELGYSRWSSVL